MEFIVCGANHGSTASSRFPALQVVQLGHLGVVVADEALLAGVERRAAAILDAVAAGVVVDVAQRGFRKPTPKRKPSAAAVAGIGVQLRELLEPGETNAGAVEDVLVHRDERLLQR